MRIEELGVRQTLLEDVTTYRRQPDQVRAGLRMQEQISAAGHFMLPEVGDNELLPAQLVSAFNTAGQHGMTLGGVAANDEDKVGLLDVGDGAGIAAVADGAE